MVKAKPWENILAVLHGPRVKKGWFPLIAGHFAMANGQFNAKGQAAPKRHNLRSNLGDQSL